MKSIQKILILLLLFAFSLSCGSGTKKATVAEPPESGKANQPADTLAAAPNVVVTAGLDNSEIHTSYDADGNMIETRVFKSHQYLDKIEIKTLANNKKVGVAYQKNGLTKELADHQIAIALNSKADELSSSFGFGLKIVEKPPPPVEAPSQNPASAEFVESVPAPETARGSTQTEPERLAVENTSPDAAEKRAKAAEAEKVKRLQKDLSLLQLKRSN